MNSGMIGKVEKAHRYVQERRRFQFTELQVRIQGDNSDHDVSLSNGEWRCNCEFFEHNDTCAHTMALELLLEGMITKQPQLSMA
jgi:hypothetical protein